MNKKAQIAEILIDLAAVILALIFLLIFVFYFNSCTPKANSSIESIDFEDIRIKANTLTYLKTPIVLYNINTDISNIIVWNELLSNHKETEVIFSQLYKQTGLYPKIKISEKDFNLDPKITRVSYYVGDTAICYELSFLIPNNAYDKKSIKFVPCYTK